MIEQYIYSVEQEMLRKFPFSQLVPHALLEALEADSYPWIAYGIWLGTRVVGALIVQDRPRDDACRLCWLVVSAAMRRQGLGRSLMEHATNEADARGMRTMYYLEPHKPPYIPKEWTQEFFQACGWSPLEPCQVESGSGDGEHVVFRTEKEIGK